MKYQYPKDAVETLFRTSSTDVIQRLFPLKVPRHLVRELAEIAYHSSFLAEEGRPTRFQLALLPRDIVPTGSLEAKDEMTVLRLQAEVPLSVKEILRLAPAADATTSLICVDAAMHVPGVANRGLDIWGIVSPGLSAKRLTRLQSNEAVHVPSCLIISSWAPGHIQLALNIRPLVVLRGGKVTVLPRKPKGLPGPIVQLLRSNDLSTSEVADTPLAADGESLHAKYVETFCRLLMALADTHHGATLLYVSTSAIPILDSILSIKYRVCNERLRKLLREIVISDGRSNTAASLINDPHRFDRLLSEALDVISATSAVDGALVLNDRLEVVGFGAEIQVNDVALDHMHFSSGQSDSRFSAKPLTDFGTRHRSAARFCKAVPGSVAFVVSQDGDRRLMTCVDGRVLVWTNLNWESLWETV